MKFLLDENVSLLTARILTDYGYEVVTISGERRKGIADSEVWELACTHKAALITRDFHFANETRFPAQMCSGIILIRPGNLTSSMEADLIRNFLLTCQPVEWNFALTYLTPSGFEIRRRNEEPS